MALRVLIPEKVAQSGIEYLRRRGYAIRPGSGADEATLCQEVKGCHAILARINRYGRPVFEAADCLRVLSRHGAGYDNVDLAAAKEFGVVVTHTPHANTVSVAEHTMFLLLACARQATGVYRGFVQGGNYAVRGTLPGAEVAGATLGLVGLGNIALAVAQMAHCGFGMRVVGYSPHAAGKSLPPYITALPSLQAVLQMADYVSLHLPATPATRHIIGAAQLQQMRPEAVLINTARGEVVNEAALLKALQNGTIAGAGLDVYETEPPGAAPLLQLANVVATPHMGGLTRQALHRMSLEAAMGIDDVLQGRAPQWPVPL